MIHYAMHHVSCIIPHASCILPHASCLLHHASCIMHHASCIINCASYIIFHKWFVINQEKVKHLHLGSDDRLYFALLLVDHIRSADNTSQGNIFRKISNHYLLMLVDIAPGATSSLGIYQCPYNYLYLTQISSGHPDHCVLRRGQDTLHKV